MVRDVGVPGRHAEPRASQAPPRQSIPSARPVRSGHETVAATCVELASRDTTYRATHRTADLHTPSQTPGTNLTTANVCTRVGRWVRCPRLRPLAAGDPAGMDHRVRCRAQLGRAKLGLA